MSAKSESSVAEPDHSYPTFKRRKIHHLRRRSLSPTPSEPCPSPPSISTTPPSCIPRKPARRRLGLEVSSSKPLPSASLTLNGSGTIEEKAAAKAQAEMEAVVNRFTHQTGQVADVDKHMMAYIEAEMAKRRGVASATPDHSAVATVSEMKIVGPNSYWQPTRPEARGATLGKLHEVDLGEEARQRNITLTQQATQRLSSTPGLSSLQHEDSTTAHRKNKRRRTSQDLARDKLVEEVLRETRLELYNDAENELDDGDEEEAADDKIAEKFRKEFVEALINRRRKGGRTEPQRAGKKGVKDEKRPKGPKLGGSRMARQQMRERESAAGK